MIEIKNVLSLFDGIGCGQVALNKAGIKYDTYFASEIDKYAIKKTQENFPNTIQLGSVVDIDVSKLPPIQWLLGGSPCQSFSFAGKRKGMSTTDNIEILTLDHYLELKSANYEFEGQSYLFWEYVRILREAKPRYFFLENVMMEQKWEKVISDALGVKPVKINSALVSAQSRPRNYWFGQIRERLYYTDFLCYICGHAEEKQGIHRETQDNGAEPILGKTQERQKDLCDLQEGISANGEKGDDQNLLLGVSGNKPKTDRQESKSGETSSLSERILSKEQEPIDRVSEGVSENPQGERGNEESGSQSIKKNGEENENPSPQRKRHSEKTTNKGRSNSNNESSKSVCCVSCGKGLNDRPHKTFIQRRNQRNWEPANSLSEMQFKEARQNNGRVFDVFAVGIPEADGLFGERGCIIPQPKDRGIYLKDILETNVDEKYYISEHQMKRLKIGNLKTVGQISFSMEGTENNKATSLLSRDYKGISGKQGFNVVIGASRGRNPENPTSREAGLATEQHLEERGDGKTNCLTSVAKDNYVVEKGINEVIQLNDSKESNGCQPFQQNRVYDIKGKSPALMAQMSSGIHAIQEGLIELGNIYDNGHNSVAGRVYSIRGKSSCLSALGGGGGAKTGLYMVEHPTVHNMMPRSSTTGKGGTGHLSRTDGKTYTLATSDINRVEYKQRIRRLTEIEAERLQGLPDDFTKGISSTQRYRCLGNGWQVDTIVYLFGYFKG